MLFPGQKYPSFGGTAFADDSSLAIGQISGGNYPAGSFSINNGHTNKPFADSRPGAYPVNGGNRPINPNYDGGNGQQNGGGYVVSPNYNGSNGQYGQNRPAQSWDNGIPNNNGPINNSALSQNIFLRRFF